MEPSFTRDTPYAARRTALLLVDMQRIWLEPGRNPRHPDWDHTHPFYERVWSSTIPNQVRLLEAAREAGIEVLHTIIESLTTDGRDRSLDHKLSNIHVPRGSELAQPVSPLAPRPDEIVLPKTSSGVFNSTAIDYVLRNLGVEFLVVAGIMTDQCVDMAVRDGADRGYMVTCVADACAAQTVERHETALKAFGGYGWITDTETVVARFGALK